MKIQTLTLLFGLLIALSSCNPRSSQWEFHYPGDKFSPEALLDLRYLNESYAGEHGMIHLSENGESFVRGDGEPIRFWPVNGGGSTQGMSDEELAWHARFLAKQGVNMNRWHGSINPSGMGTDIFELDTAEIEAIWRWEAAMKKEGIYSTISPFWAHNGHMGGWIPEEWGIEGYSGNDELWEVMYFNDRLKEAYKHWVKYLYTEINPYTGIPLKDDPAVALIQVKNEDGIFFWTMQDIKPGLKKLVKKQFAEWVKGKYGSLNRAFEAWEGETLPEDDPANELLDIYTTWDMTQDQQGGRAFRITDQTEFYAFRQRSFYDEIHNFYRNELGCKQLINPNNWKTADPTRLNDLERWTYLGCEVPAVNRYYDPGHYGENNGWRIDPGHFYEGRSCLLDPLKLPINSKQTYGSPMIITESGWNLPHKYQSEAPALIAAYQSLTGHDAFYWFYITSKDYMEFPYFKHTRDSLDRYAMNRWTYSTPGGIAQFPAYALLFRKGYLSQGELMVHEVRSLDAMWKREPAAISEETSFDPNRDRKENIPGQSSANKLNPFAFLTGPVMATYGGDPSETYINEKIDDLIDIENGKVAGVTGEMELDFKNGIFKFEASQAAGLSGFLGNQKNFELDDISITTTNEYITIGVVSMDELPIRESNRILIQTGTIYRPTDWMEEPDEMETRNGTIKGFNIINTGRMPWLADNTELEIHVNNKQIRNAYLLNMAGYPIRNLPIKLDATGCKIKLPPEALYVILTGEEAV